MTSLDEFVKKLDETLKERSALYKKGTDGFTAAICGLWSSYLGYKIEGNDFYIMNSKSQADRQ